MIVQLLVCVASGSGIRGEETFPEVPQPGPNVVSLGPAVVDVTTEYEYVSVPSSGSVFESAAVLLKVTESPGYAFSNETEVVAAMDALWAFW